jgi:hypothetical protein
MPPQIAVVRVSAKAGHIKALRVIEKRHDGWIRCVTLEKGSQRDPRGVWFAPHHVLSFHSETQSYDYNGIESGTLVNFWGDQFGIVTERKGAQYTVLDPTSGEERNMSHEGIVPVMQSSEVMNVT